MNHLTARIVAVLALASGVLASSVGGTAGAQTVDRALLVVLDVSGSMKESVDGGVKSDLAQRGLLARLRGLPTNVAVGLRVLGEGGDLECAASEQRMAFGRFDESAWRDELARIAWSGTTPLSHTLREAFAELAAQPAARREILLIGDGEETCEEDPVATARAHHAGIRVHTLNLGRAFSQQLAGIALVTGGTYANAYDDVSFAAAAEGALPDLAMPAPVAAPSATAAGTLQIILDVSNSMWGQVEGRAKIELAREALRGALAEVPSGVRVGLRAYGHRTSHEDRDASCADTELMVAPAAGTEATIQAAAEQLVPRGQTPIARSLRAAAGDVDGAESAVILLVSDGVESCDGDPMAAAAELRAAGFPVILHTVGLGVTPDEAQILEQLATAGGGEYYDAPTALDLSRGMQGAVRRSSDFVVAEDELPGFPSPVTRVAGGSEAAQAQVIERGFFSLEEHLEEGDQRYFAVAGSPGQEVGVRGLVCALGIAQRRDGKWVAGATTDLVFYQAVDGAGERQRGGNRRMRVTGDMGEWFEMRAEVGADGYARFRVGRDFGNVNRDTLFEIR